MLPRLISLLLLVGIAACTTLPESPGASVAGFGPPLESFVASGRLALKHEARSHTLRFRWSHAPDHDEVFFISPLGQGLAELRRDSSSARLVQPGQADLIEPSMERLSHRLFGTPLPLQRLTDWMRAAVAGPAEIHAGWQVQAAESMQWQGHTVVKRLEARRGETVLRLVVEQWGEETAEESDANLFPGARR